MTQLAQSEALLIIGFLWSSFVLVPYALSLELRRLLSSAVADESRLHAFTSHVFEWWSAALGICAGFVLGCFGPVLEFAQVSTGGFLTTLAMGGGGYLIATVYGYKQDVDGHIGRAFVYVVIVASLYFAGAIVGAFASPSPYNLLDSLPVIWKAVWGIVGFVALILGLYQAFKPPNSAG